MLPLHRLTTVVKSCNMANMPMITDWEAKSNCRGQKTLFESIAYGANEKPKSPDDLARVAEAKRLCITCPVRQECLTDAMNEEAYLGGTERHGMRGGLTARDRVLIAAEDPICARCRVKPVVQTNTVAKIRRMCGTCQSSTQNDITARYFPPKARPLRKFFDIS